MNIMELEYNTKLELANLLLLKINPLRFVLGDDMNYLDCSEGNKKLIRKEFHKWCLKNHPDKVDNRDETAEFILKEYGNAILKFEDDTYEHTWLFMFYALYNLVPKIHNPMAEEDLKHIGDEILVFKEMYVAGEVLNESVLGSIDELDILVQYMIQFEQMKNI